VKKRDCGIDPFHLLGVIDRPTKTQSPCFLPQLRTAAMETSKRDWKSRISKNSPDKSFPICEMLLVYERGDLVSTGEKIKVLKPFLDQLETHKAKTRKHFVGS
jgi:hypothetical protein